MMRIFLHSILLWCAAAFSESKPIISTQVQFDVETTSDFKQSVNVFLERFINEPASKENETLAEEFLRSLYSVYAADCRYEDDSGGQKLQCKMSLRRTIREVRVINLPASLLESELKRRLSIEAGQIIDIDETIASILNVVKGRVDIFLRKNGFFDATVSVSYDAPANVPWADIKIEIEGGRFARVNQVTVVGDSPIAPSSMRRQFSRMCLSFNRIIEAISMGMLSCYSRELERETVGALHDRIAAMGYVQSQLRVSHHWIDPNDKNAPAQCRSINDKPPPYRCVNLRVHVDKGPLFRWDVVVKDGSAISRNAFLRFVASIFSVDQLSRVSTSYESDELALDHDIIKQELADQVTFVSAKNIDEQELSESAANMRDYLIGRGYANAEVIPNLVQEDEANVVITFDVYADKPFFVQSVKVVPDRFSQFIDVETLQSLVPTRSFTEIGKIAYAMIDGAKEEIKNRLQARGFSDLTVNAEMEASGNGAVAVTFNVTGSNRAVLEELSIVNGYHSLNEEILPYLHNCDKFVPEKRHSLTRKFLRAAHLCLQ